MRGRTVCGSFIPRDLDKDVPETIADGSDYIRQVCKILQVVAAVLELDSAVPCMPDYGLMRLFVRLL